MDVLFDDKKIHDAMESLAQRIADEYPDGSDLAIIGIRSRGEVLAKRLTELIENRLGGPLASGVLDITLYRDDLNDPQGEELPTVRSTEIPFDVHGKVIILVDDVLYTGRSVRAAMDALVDLGRPRAIRLAVLIDRGQHEYPIQADYVGYTVDVPHERLVEVHLRETDEVDEVIVAE